jgi:hypothetical protein
MQALINTMIQHLLATTIPHRNFAQTKIYTEIQEVYFSLVGFFAFATCQPGMVLYWKSRSQAISPSCKMQGKQTYLQESDGQTRL